MYPIDPIYTVNMNEQQRAWFYAEFQRARKDEVVGVLLAVILGDFGVHHFYLRRDGLGILYLLFFWTGIPALIGLFEAFLMPSRIRRYNAMQAMYISSQILGTAPPAGVPTPGSRTWAQTPAPTAARCDACGNLIDPTAIFCNHCGAAIAHTGLSTQPSL